MKKENKTLREKLADLEHEQWMSWSKHVRANNVVPIDLLKKWENNWKPYSELDEKTKDSDRIWADKVLEVFKEHTQNARRRLKEEFDKWIILRGNRGRTKWTIYRKDIEMIYDKIDKIFLKEFGGKLTK